MGFATQNAYLLQLIAATLAGNEADTYITISGYSRAVARSIDLEGLTLRDLGFESATDYLLQLIVATIAANESDTYLTKSTRHMNVRSMKNTRFAGSEMLKGRLARRVRDRGGRDAV
jgi:hypothetical protein